MAKDVEIEVMSSQDILDETLDPIQSYLGDGLITKESRTLIVGPTESRKSFFAQQLCVSLAAGRDFLGISVPQPVKTYYIQIEVPRYYFKLRTEKFVEEFGILEGQVHYARLRGFRMTGGEHWKALKNAIIKSQADFVMIDPLRSVYPGNENSNADMTDFTDMFDSVQWNMVSEQGLGGSFGIVHHMGKTKRDGMTGQTIDEGTSSARGASVLGDWADSIIRVTKLPKVKDTSEIKWDKARNAADGLKPDPMWATLKNGILVPAGLSPVIVASKIMEDKKVIDSKDLFRLIRKSAECGLPAAKDAVDALVQSGKVEINKDPNDKRHFLVKWKGKK